VLSGSVRARNLIHPCLRREDRSGCLGRQSPALMLRVPVPAHFDQAGWRAGVGERQQRNGSDRLRLLRGWDKRDDRP
jgi:hypothetical protein